MNDPFLSARAKFASQQSATKGGAPQPAQAGLASTLAKAGGHDAYQGSKLPAMLSHAGIPSQGLAMNDLGAMQLHGRLQAKFGADYANHPQAKDIMSAFQAEKSKAPMAGQKSMNVATATAQRSLKALLGGK